jgi:PAS domain S-box-containing protein
VPQKASLKNNIVIAFILIIIAWGILLSNIFQYAMRIEIAEHTVSQDIARHFLMRAAVIIGGCTILGGVFIIFVALYLAKIITAPLDKLKDGMREISKGNLDARVKIDSQDEIGALADAFNQMTINLRNMTVLKDELTKEVAERKKLESFLKDVLDSVDPLVVMDTGYKIISANKAYCEKVNMPVEEIIGKHCYEVSHKQDKPCYLTKEECGVRHTLEEGKPYTFIHTHYGKSGEPIFAEVSTYPVKNESGEIVLIIETITDITERRRLEVDSQKRLKELEMFNRLAIDRELKMVELKNKITDLENKLGG